jgi:hypothetical protein
MGIWQETALVVVELGDPDATNTSLTFAPRAASCGISVKKIKLTSAVEGCRDDSYHSCID